MSDFVSVSMSSVALPAVAQVLGIGFDNRHGVSEWRSMLRRELDDGRVDGERSCVALQGAEAVGACLVNVGPGGLARIGPTAVVPSSRREGVGRRLVESALQGIASAGRSQVTLEVDSDNVGAIALYEKLGFAKVRGMSIMASRRSSLRSGSLTAERIPEDDALAAAAGMHRETPAYQRMPFYLETFQHGLVAHGVRRRKKLVGVVLQRGRALLDVAAVEADPDVIRALLVAAAELSWVLRLINVVEDDPVGALLPDLGFSVESHAFEMAKRLIANPTRDEIAPPHRD